MINVLCGATPGYLKDTLPEVAWEQGFMARMFIIYSPTGIHYDIEDKFDGTDEGVRFPPSFVQYLRDLCDRVGCFRWTPEARRAFADWHNEDYAPKPNHPRLANYSNGRMIHAMKLSMISAISRGIEAPYMLEIGDFLRAKGWMLEAEALMPEVFHAMGGRGDKAVMLDLHNHLLAQQRLHNIDRVRDEIAYAHLTAAVQSERIPRILEMGMRAGLWELKVPNYITALEGPKTPPLIEGKPQ
jgi:hypothetical protein